MIAHRWHRYEEAALWRCDPPELGLTRAEGSCGGCRLVVTDEHFDRSLPYRAGAVPVWSWLNALAEQSVEWWAERGMTAPAVQSIRTWLPS